MAARAYPKLAQAMLVAALILSMPATALASSCRVGAPDAWGRCPRVLHMKHGSYGILVDGAVTPERYNTTYALAVGANQTMSVTFAGAHELQGSIVCGDSGDGPWNGSGNSYTTKAAGTCFITVGANTRAGEPWTGGFSLAVVIK